MGYYLLAVLVDDTATVATIGAHLAAPMRRLIRQHRVDGYRLGGGVTGAWDPDHDPAADPANWRPCDTCAATTQVGGQRCTVCAAAVDLGRTAGTVVAWNHSEWAAHPGDIVPLARLMDRGWRFPAGRTPNAWVDRAGVVWLDTTGAIAAGTDTGDTPPLLRTVFDDLLTGRRNPEPRVPRHQRRFDHTTWQVAVVHAHH